MNNSTNEIGESQMGAALAAGNRATSENLKDLRHQISLIRDIASQYFDLYINDEKTIKYFVFYFVRQLKTANELLKGYVEELKQGKCVEAICISTGRFHEDSFWTWCDKMCSDMAKQMVYGKLKENLDQLKKLLTDSEDTIRHCNPALFEKFFFDEEQNYSYDGVKKRFEEWMFDNINPGIEKLRDLQALVVAKALKKGIMDFIPVPSQKEIDDVMMDILKRRLPWDFEIDEAFKEACARWRQFMHWDGPLLMINYKKYGKYIQNHYYDFNDEQLHAIFELDMMVHLINDELARLNNKLVFSPTHCVPDKELFKYIHPAICDEEALHIHEEVKRLVIHYGIPEICQYLYQMAGEKKIMLPQMPSLAYNELVRMGMPTTTGYSEKCFQKYYHN